MGVEQGPNLREKMVEHSEESLRELAKELVENEEKRLARNLTGLELGQIANVSAHMVLVGVGAYAYIEGLFRSEYIPTFTAMSNVLLAAEVSVSRLAQKAREKLERIREQKRGILSHPIAKNEKHDEGR